MARRTWTMIDLMELFRHWHSGRSQVQIAEALDIDRKTIRKYLAPAVAAGLTPGEGGKFDEPLWWELITGWFPEVGDPAARAVTWPAIAAHHDWIDGQLTASVTVATIAQRLRDDHGVAVSESTVRRYVAAQFAEKVAESKVTVARGAVPPGDEALCGVPHKASYEEPDNMRRPPGRVDAGLVRRQH
ncbi:hypothetical protein [Rhodococcus opacus]|uniref:hypothetical protein n=2 Tax=Rhodococcus opacus TaxID=37919 RepID=UPI003AF6CDB2